MQVSSHTTEASPTTTLLPLDSATSSSNPTPNIMPLPSAPSPLLQRLERGSSGSRLVVAHTKLLAQASVLDPEEEPGAFTFELDHLVHSLPFDHVFVQELDTGRYLYQNPGFARLGFTHGFEGGVLSQESAQQLEAVVKAAASHKHKTTHSQWVTFHHPHDDANDGGTVQTPTAAYSTGQARWDLTLFPIRAPASGKHVVVALGGWINVRQVRSETESSADVAPAVADAARKDNDSKDPKPQNDVPKGLYNHDHSHEEEEEEVADDYSSNPNCPNHQHSQQHTQYDSSSTKSRYSRDLQEAVRESEERHQTLFENMKQGVVYHAMDGSTIAANHSALRLLGLTMDQMLGRTPMDPQWKFVYEDGTAIPVEQYPAVVALSGTPVTNMILGIYSGGPVKDGNINWVQLDAMPRFRPGCETPYQAYTIFTDITQAKLVEQNLTRAKEKAEEADHLKSAFLATMSHEIRTPLNGIMGHLDLILSNGLSQDCRDENLEGLQVALNSGNLLLSIIQDILDLSKIEAGQLDIEDRCIPVRAMVANTMKLTNAYCIQRKKEHLKLLASVHDNIADCVGGDQFRVQQVLNNLLSNAIKFTDTGTVSLSVRRAFCHKSSRNYIEFCVQDTGKGIRGDRLEVIFEPFRQVDFSDTREHGGTGLGLTICRKLIEVMGGTMRVESDTHAGTSGSRFYFRLPYKPMDCTCGHAEETKIDVAANPLLAGSPSDSPPIQAHRSGTVLLAEDDVVSRKVAMRMLQNAGMEVLAARDGAEAVLLFEKHRNQIDMILMDVMMPNMDGLEATERIRDIETKSTQSSTVPICALSAGAMKGDRERGLQVGMTDYLYKPINRAQLLRTLEMYLGQESPVDPVGAYIIPELPPL